MPAQIKLATAITNAPIAPTGTTLVGAQNSILIANEQNHAEIRSEFHAGPTQPLGKTKMWFDTTNNCMKLNNGKEWVDARREAPPKGSDFGGFKLVTVYTGITQRFRHVASETTYDEVSPTVRLTRGSSGWLYNSLQENASADNTPSGTEWAFAGIDGNPEIISAANYASLNFKPFAAAADSYSAYRMAYIPAVCHLIAEDIYFDIQLAAWFECNEANPNDGLIIIERAAIPGSSTGMPIPTTVTVTIEERNLITPTGTISLYINSILYTPGTYQLIPGNYTIVCNSSETNEYLYSKFALESNVTTEYTVGADSYTFTNILAIAESISLNYGAFDMNVGY